MMFTFFFVSKRFDILHSEYTTIRSKLLKSIRSLVKTHLRAPELYAKISYLSQLPSQVFRPKLGNFWVFNHIYFTNDLLIPVLRLFLSHNYNNYFIK